MPITSMELRHETSTARVSNGVAALDAMTGGRGLAAHFAHATAERGERCSIGID